jgi:hypothetical protein
MVSCFSCSLFSVALNLGSFSSFCFLCTIPCAPHSFQLHSPHYQSSVIPVQTQLWTITCTHHDCLSFSTTTPVLAQLWAIPCSPPHLSILFYNSYSTTAVNYTLHTATVNPFHNSYSSAAVNCTLHTATVNPFHNSYSSAAVNCTLHTTKAFTSVPPQLWTSSCPVPTTAVTPVL